jgi:hypothetical protein
LMSRRAPPVGDSRGRAFRSGGLLRAGFEVAGAFPGRVRAWRALDAKSTSAVVVRAHTQTTSAVVKGSAANDGTGAAIDLLLTIEGVAQPCLTVASELRRLARPFRMSEFAGLLVAVRPVCAPVTRTSCTTQRPSLPSIRAATGGNPRRQIWPVSAVFAHGRFATDCHWLRPLGS